MSTRNRWYVLAGVLGILLVLSGAADLRYHNGKYRELQTRMAAQDAAHSQKLEELKTQHDQDLATLDDLWLQDMEAMANAVGRGLNAVHQDAEAELREANDAWEQRLAALQTASDAQRATDEARIAALEEQASEHGAGATGDLASIWKEYNGVVKIYVYSRFEFDRLVISPGPDGKWKIEIKKYKFQGVVGHLSGFIVEKAADGSDGDYQYLVSAGHLKHRDNARPITGLQCAFRDDLNLPSEKLELVGYDWRYDLSLLRFRKGFAFPGKAFRLGDMSSVHPSDKVVALGNPLDAQFCATEGEVMDMDYLGAEQGLTQPRILVHSAQMTFGNSGGPLILKRTGEVIGVNVMLMDEPGGYFMSVPVDDLKAMYPRLKNAHGLEVRHSQLEHAAFANSWRMLPNDWEDIGVPAVKNRCVVVTEVKKDSVAAKAGLVAGDIVLEWNGVAPKDDADLWRMITNIVPGTAVGTMKVQRGDETKELKIALMIFNGEVFVHERYKIEEVPPPAPEKKP